MILSSMKTRPNLLDRRLLNVWYSSGIISCCCLSRHFRVFSKFGSFVTSVISSCGSVEKFFSVSHIACTRFQSFFSSAAIRGACLIFTYCTLFTSTYRAMFLLVLLRLMGLGRFPSRCHLPWESIGMLWFRLGAISLMMGQVCQFGSVGLRLVGPALKMDLPSIVQSYRLWVENLHRVVLRLWVGGLLGPGCLSAVEIFLL